MAFIKTRKTAKGITYHIVDLVNGQWKARKVAARNKSEAQACLQRYMGDKLEARPNALMMEKVRFSEFVEEYLIVSRGQKNESTYRKDLSHLIPLKEKWGGCDLNEISYRSIQAAQTEWLGKGLSRKTVNNRSKLLSAILRMAHKQKKLVEMPEIPNLKVDKRPPKWYSTEQIDLILSDAKPWVVDMVTLLVNSGIRVGELRRLEWRHISLERRSITVEVAKSHKFRVIPVNDTLYARLIEMERKARRNQQYVFEAQNGGQRNDFYNPFKSELVRLGIEGTLHELRHTFASYLVQKGVSVFEVQKLLGHASVQTTQIYAHLDEKTLISAVSKLNRGNEIGTKSEPRAFKKSFGENKKAPTLVRA